MDLHLLRLLVVLLLAVPLTSARMLRQAGAQQAPHALHSDGAIPNNVVPGTDIFVIDTTQDRTGHSGGVLSNNIQDNARSGSTYDLAGTVARTQAVNRANEELRSAIGTQDHSSKVQEAVSGSTNTAAATRDAQGVATVTARGRGKTLSDPGNRSALAAMDASSAIQTVTNGMTSDLGVATRAGTASAASVTVPTSYWFVFVPTWWR